MNGSSKPCDHSSEDASAIAQAWLSKFAAALCSGGAETVGTTFLPDGWLRDVLTFTWDTRTLEGRSNIVAYLSNKLLTANISNVALCDDQYFRPAFAQSDLVVEFGYTYETPIAFGKGFVQLRRDNNFAKEWKGHIVSMMLMDLKGHEEVSGRRNVEDVLRGRTWGEYQTEQRSRIESDPHVVIIGAGQIGLQIAARFKAMDIPTLVIETNERVGDNWRKRYDSLALHTTPEQHQLLYQPHADNWPVFPPRDKVATMLETYAMSQELVVWTNSHIVGRPVYSADARRWTIRIDHDGFEVELYPAHIVVATGTLGAPNIPSVPDQDRFLGDVLHASQYTNHTSYVGKRVVVIGAGNTAIDICEELACAEIPVTMVQRSPTLVVGRDTGRQQLEQIHPPGIPADVSDFKTMSVPRMLLVRMMLQPEALKAFHASQADLHEKLRKGGVLLNMETTHGVLVWKQLAGFWLDKGGADLIASGAIKVKSSVQPTSFKEDGLVFSDGSELPADVVIFATGYQNIRESNKQLFGAQVVHKTKPVWGFDEEGEISGSYRPSGHAGLWYGSGGFEHARFYSKHLALQIKAIEMGLNKT